MFNVPAYSQFLDVKNRHWRNKSCGVVALKSVLEYWKNGDIDVDALTKRGKKLKAYLEDIGWKHAGLALLARQHGLRAKNFDWAKFPSHAAWKKLGAELKNGPVIASIYKNLKPKTSGHLVVITGIKKGLIYYNDPGSKTKRDVEKRASKARFLRGWKKRIIVVLPKRNR